MRPVAVGDTVRCSVEKLGMALPATKELLQSLLPRQAGFGGNGSCEQIALTLQAVLDGNPHEGRWIVMQVDIRNAFNTGSGEHPRGTTATLGASVQCLTLI